MSAQSHQAEDEFEEHERTYRAFVRGVIIFTAHVFAVLLILAYIFVAQFG